MSQVRPDSVPPVTHGSSAAELKMMGLPLLYRQILQNAEILKVTHRIYVAPDNLECRFGFIYIRNRICFPCPGRKTLLRAY